MWLTAATVAPIAGWGLNAVLRPLHLDRTRTFRMLGPLFSLSVCLIAFIRYAPVADDLSSLWISEPARTLIPAWSVVYEPRADGVSLALALMLTGLALAVASFPHEHVRQAWGGLSAALTCALAALFAADAAVFLAALDTACACVLWVSLRASTQTRTAVLRSAVYHTLLSAPVWLSLLGLHWAGGGAGFRLPELLSASVAASPTARERLAVAFLLGLAMRIPLVPFHRWTVVLAGRGSPIISALLFPLTSYIAAYGLMRFGVTIFPDADATLGVVVGGLAAAGLIHLGMLTYTDPDAAYLFSHACTALCSLTVIGLVSLTRAGVGGAVLLMVSQGLVMGALFLILAALGTRGRWSLATIFSGMPRLTALAAVGILALAGFPGTVGFVAQIMTLAGAFREYPAITIAGALGLAPITVGLIALQRRDTVIEPRIDPPSRIHKLNRAETVPIVALLGIVIALGVFPRLLLDRITPTVDRYCEELSHRREIARALRDPIRAVEDPFAAPVESGEKEKKP